MTRQEERARQVARSLFARARLIAAKRILVALGTLLKALDSSTQKYRLIPCLVAAGLLVWAFAFAIVAIHAMRESNNLLEWSMPQ